MSDISLHVRRNPDRIMNELGTSLLSICKSTGLRMLNGRHKDGNASDFTFCGSRGRSVVDYLVVPFELFHTVLNFNVGDFTTFSDLAPLNVEITCKNTRKQENYYIHVEVNCENIGRYRWNHNLKDHFYEQLTLNSGALSETVFNEIDLTQDGIDSYVNTFVEHLSDIVYPYHRVPEYSGECPNASNIKSKKQSQDKPWFYVECKRPRNLYLSHVVSALHNFNVDKSIGNHQNLSL